MAKIRVYELAKEMEISSKDLVQALQQGGIDVKNHMSTMEESQVTWVRRHFKDGVLDPRSQSPEKKESEPAREKAGSDKPKTTTNRQESVPTKPSAEVKTVSQASLPKPGTPVAPRGQRGTQSSVPRPAGQPSVPSGSRPPASTQRPGGFDRKPGEQRKPGGLPRQGQGNFNRQGDDRRSTTAPRPASDRGTNSNPRPPQGQAGQRGGGGAPRPGTETRKPETRPGQERRDRPAQNNYQKGAVRPGAGKNKTGGTQGASRDYTRPGKRPKQKKKKEETIRLPEKISIPDTLQVREYAELLFKPSAEIMKKLMELGMMATINQQIDYDTMEILSSMYGVEVERALTREEKILEQIVDAEETLQKRPPIVTVMGHVDHGKTSLLDWVRRSNVVSGEAGGITQHIGAYQVKVNQELITFIDTPGHEAFTAMRARGANLTDIVILVVAADDGVMPQTIEAINHIKAAGVPFIVALNKMDKPDINPERVKQQLTEYSIVPEDWGGDTVFVPVSAKTGIGMEHLLEMVLLISEMHDIKANPNRNAEGVIVESRLDKGRGAVATVLVQKGTIHVGDYIISGVNWCKVRSMLDDKGRRIDVALPSTPIEITGWSDVPEAGEKVQAVDEKVAKEVSALRITDKKLEDQKKSSRVTLDDFYRQMQDSGAKELNLIIKGDVQGSIEALSQSLLKLSTNEVKVSVIHMAVGAVKEADVMLASASNAIIIGFNVRPDVNARQYAENENIDIRLYRIIYEAIEDVKKAMVGLLDPEYREKYLGRAEVRQVIKVPNVGSIAGSYVIDGKIQRGAKARILRDGVIVYEGSLSSLKRFKDDAKEVLENFECGIGVKDFNDVKEGDIIEAYVMEEIPRTLN